MPAKQKYFILKIESFEGEDTHIRCGDALGLNDFLYCVVVTKADGQAEIIDSGYRSEEEVRKAWPEIKACGR